MGGKSNELRQIDALEKIGTQLERLVNVQKASVVMSLSTSIGGASLKEQSQVIEDLGKTLDEI